MYGDRSETGTQMSMLSRGKATGEIRVALTVVHCILVGSFPTKSAIRLACVTSRSQDSQKKEGRVQIQISPPRIFAVE